MLGVRVLGELAIELDGRVIEPPTSRRARSLLGLLVVDRRAHSRSQLAARFWPDVLDESARTSLRGALSALRKALGPGGDQLVVAVRDGLALADERLVWTDFSEFDSLVAAGRLEAALALRRGELLEGLDDDWVLQARDEHRDRVAGVLAALAQQAEGRGELREAVALTRRQTALDPLAEEPQRELIRRLAAAGDRAAAIQAYRRLQERLRGELGIAPSASTRELVQTLRIAAPASQADEAHAGPLEPPAAPLEPPAGALEPPAGVYGEVPAAGAAGVAAQARPAGTVTLLFTDEVSSTEMLLALGDDEAQRRRRIHFRLLREVAAAHRGHEVKNLGDGLMVAFASAVDAVACAIGIQQAIAHHAQGARRPLTVRVGLNVGEPIVDDGDYFGTPVVLAKRLCDAAEGGQILAADVVRTLVGTRGGFQFERLDPLSLKGISELTPVSEVRWEGTAEQRVTLPPALTGSTGAFVGRARKLELLDRHWAAVGAGARRVVLISGEPGIGKTRLVAEFCQAAHARGAVVLVGRCHEDMVIPFEPFAEALRNYVASCPPAELTVQLAGRRGELESLVPELGDGAVSVASGSPADPEQGRFRLFEAVASLITSAARARPIVLVLDDLHWADEPSLLMLRHLVRASEDSRLLILCTYRQIELDRGGPLAAALAELRRGRALDQIELDGLPRDEVSALIEARSGEAAAASLARQIAERTDGNPFFVEELLRHLEGDPSSELDRLELPDSVKDLLLRRLSRLDEDTQRALVLASVAGHEFDLIVLECVLEHSEDELAELLEHAIQAHVLVEEATAIGRYRFAHPLIREAIYEDISLTRRALVHRRIGAAIESVHAARLSEHAGALALHFHAAGDPQKAFAYHNLASVEAERAHAGETAFEHLTGAIAAGELLGRTPKSDGVMRDLYRRRAWNGQFYGTFEVVQRDYEVALDGARAGGDRALEMRLLNEIGTSYHVRNSALSASLLEQSLALAEELGHDPGKVNALNRLSLLYGNQLDLERAQRLAERALALARSGTDQWAHLQALDALKFVALLVADIDRLEQLTAELAHALRSHDALWYLQWTLEESAFASIARRRYGEAAARIDESLAISERIGDTFSRGLILMMRSRLEHARGDYARALAAGEEALQLTTEGKGHVWLGWTAGWLAGVMIDLRAWTRARELLETACEAAERMDARAQLFSVLGDLAWARIRCGDRAGAQLAADRWDAMLEDIRMPAGRAYVHCWHTYTDRARAAIALGDVVRAETVMRDVSEPVVSSGIRDAAADLDAVRASCALARGDRKAAIALLSGALRNVGDHGQPAARLTLRIALARLGPPGPEAAEHVHSAEALIEQIARSVGDAGLAEQFRDSARSELASEATSPGYGDARARHVTS